MRADEDGGASRGRGALFHGKPAGAAPRAGAAKTTVEPVA
jgi:hypothetical protein